MLLKSIWGSCSILAVKYTLTNLLYALIGDMSRGLAISIQTDSDHCPASSLTLTLVISDSFCLVLSSSNNGFQSQYVGPDLPSALGLVYKQKSPFTPAGANYFLWKSSWSREKHSQHWGPMCSWQCLLKGKLTINLDPIIQVFIEHYGRKTTPLISIQLYETCEDIWNSYLEQFFWRLPREKVQNQRHIFQKEVAGN